MLAVLGFHRSLTSVVAQWLHLAGLPMGDYLMPPTPSNPDGHFEDMLLVGLHDQLLTAQNTDWQFQDETHLDPHMGESCFQRYVALRNERHGNDWGMKDPRQCLFLPAWDNVLGPNGKYLVVLRHWSGSIQSLMKRHGSQIAIGSGNAEADSRFWRNRSHAANIWLAYNKRLLAFVKHRLDNQCLVITQQSVLSGLELPSLLNQHFKKSLRSDTPSPVKRALVHDKIDNSILAGLSKEKIEEMEAVWQELLSFAKHTAEYEAPTWVAGKKSDIGNELLERSLLVSSNKCETPSFAIEAEPKDTLKYLRHYRKNPQLPVLPEDLWERVVASERPNDAGVWIALASVYVAKALPEWGRKALAVATDQGDSSSQIYLLRAECHLMEVNLQVAESDLKLGVEADPENTSCYIQLGKLLLMLGRMDEALDWLARGLQRLGQQPAMVNAYVTALDLVGRSEDAINYLEAIDDRPELLEKQRIALLLKEASRRADTEFQKWSLRRSMDFGAWHSTVQALAAVSDDNQKKDLSRRIVKEWRSFERM